MGDLDAVEYSIQDEYEAQINFEALDRLDPDIRSRIDMDLLAKLTNTEPALLVPKNVEEGSCDNPKLSTMSKSGSLQSLHRHFSLSLQKSHDTLSCASNRSSYNHNDNPSIIKRSKSASGVSSITMEESEGSVSPIKFVVQCMGEQNVGEVKDLLKVVTGSWLANSSLSSMPNMENKNTRVRPRGSVGGNGEGAVCLVGGEDKYAVGVTSGGSCVGKEDMVQTTREGKKTVPAKAEMIICITDVDGEQL